MTRLAGKYELVRLLGRGGMAEVWEAIAHGEAGFRRRVAVKRVAPEHAGDERLAGLFVDEARVSSALHHPNVVAVTDFGVEGGVAFQVMELVDGVDAGRLVGHVALTPWLALAIAARVGRALHAAHTAVDEAGAPLNVVHRDVSPQNVLLSRRGEVKLSDFGIARWKHRTERTLAGASRGKPSYMAPEQATKGDVDARADVFSLGCTLHALCAGSSPLADENALVDLLAGMPLALAPGLPEPIRAIVARAVERDRQARFATAEAFAAACEAALQDQAPGFAVEASIASAVAAVSPVASRGAPPAVEALHAGTLEVHVEPPIAPEPPTPLAEALPRRRVWPGIAAVSFLIVGLFALGVAVSQPPPAVPADDDLAFEPLEADRRAVVTRPVSVASSEPAAAPSVRQPVGAPAPRAPPRLGVIAVGGQRFLRGEVFVDGKSVGFAPRQLEVPVGLHPVEVHLPDGQRVGPRVMSVGAQHTEVAPLRWIED